jgi:hypothetical protein
VAPLEVAIPLFKIALSASPMSDIICQIQLAHLHNLQLGCHI